MTPSTDEMKKLLSEATPAPWVSDNHETEDGYGHYDTQIITDANAKVICEFSNADGEIHTEDDEDGISRWDETARRNAALIALAPSLAAEVIELREKLAALASPLPVEASGGGEREAFDERAEFAKCWSAISPLGVPPRDSLVYKIWLARSHRPLPPVEGKRMELTEELESLRKENARLRESLRGYTEWNPDLSKMEAE